jgi:hypothetical protein
MGNSDLTPEFTTATLMTIPAIYKTPAKGATIFWLSQASFDCYPHGQACGLL